MTNIKIIAELETRYLKSDFYTFVFLGKYVDGSPAVGLEDQKGQLQMKLTVCLPKNCLVDRSGKHKPVTKGYMLIKNYSENEGILEELLNASMISAKGGRLLTLKINKDARICEAQPEIMLGLWLKEEMEQFEKVRIMDYGKA